MLAHVTQLQVLFYYEMSIKRKQYLKEEEETSHLVSNEISNLNLNGSEGNKLCRMGN